MAASLALDARSTIEVRTFAEGMLSSVAHNLCLRCEGVEVTGRLDPEIEATLLFPVERIRVFGTIRNGVVDESAPTGIERREIERRIREDVFPDTRQIEVAVTPTEATVRWSGGRVTLPLRLSVLTLEGRPRCHGSCSLSLRALGVKPIVGPLRAFRVRDLVEIHWELIAS
jgi:hypothetical protein